MGRSLRQVVALLLGIILITGGSVALAQSAHMAPHSTVAAAAYCAGEAGCDCGDTSNSMQAGSCLAVCAASAYAAEPNAVPFERDGTVVERPFDRHSARGRDTPPDPRPPKFFDLG